MSTRRLVVIGGGIAGLAAAHRLLERTRGTTEVVLLEASGRTGGALATEYIDGFTIELGADSFLAEKPWLGALCERLGIADRLIGTAPGERRTHVVFNGRLHPLPDGFLMLAPTRLWPLAFSPLFSWSGKLRMALDLVLPRRRGDGDETLAAFVERRLGREALERAADPLVSGIYTADPALLSLNATMPRFVEMEREHRSLILGLRANARSRGEAAKGSGARYALFQSHVRGMGGLIQDITDKLPAGVVRLQTRVDALTRANDGWDLRIGGERLRADGVIIATPAYEAARLVRPAGAALADDLESIRHASSATVTLSFPSSAVGTLPGFGFVVPFVERRQLIACTFASRKFPGRAPAGWELLRCFLGGVRHREVTNLPDAELIAITRRELAELLDIRGEPGITRVTRWSNAMPQYSVEHLARVVRIERATAALPGLALAGNAYRGVGVPDCVRSGEQAADDVSGA